MSAVQEYSYDVVPYPRMSHRDAHARRLETISTLFGMTPKPLPRCRVLELGCATGWNLIPQAIDYPESEFVGVDLSGRQVAEGQATVRSLGLSNIEFRTASILDIDDSWGSFDYIICHGVYSWVPLEVQDKILAVSNENLAENGVAMVSYNTLPGWHFRGLIRDMMKYHVRQFASPQQQVAEARGLLDFLVELCPEDTAYGKMLKDEMNLLRNVQDAYLYHDHLEENNRPVYFYEFVEAAQRNGLQYLAETNLPRMISMFLPVKAQAALKKAPLLTQEQYMDFLRNTPFRATLLCHRGVPLVRDLKPDLVRNFHLALPGPMVKSDGDLNDDSSMQFKMGTAQMNTADPVVKAAMTSLSEIAPGAIKLDDLFDLAQSKLSKASRIPAKERAAAIDRLAGGLLGAIGAGLIDVYVHPPQYSQTVSDHPRVSRFALMQARSGRRVTNQRHDSIELDDAGTYLLRLLDGEHSRQALVESIQRAVNAGELQASRDGRPVADVESDVASQLVDGMLTRLSHLMLLVE